MFHDLISSLSRTRVLITIAIALTILSLIGIIVVVVTHGFAPESAALFTAWATIVGVVITQMVAARLAREAQYQQQGIEDQRAIAETLKSYLEQMGELLLNHQLRSSALRDETDNVWVVGWGGTPLVGRRIDSANPDENALAVAQVQTLAVLEELGPLRKGYLVQFLYYAGLITRGRGNTSKASISLRGANLFQAGLRGTDLSGADLSGANLKLAVLKRADLSGAILCEADLSGADLSEARLSRAILRGAILCEADIHGHRVFYPTDEALREDLRTDLSGADLSGADLSMADLSGCKVTREQLAECEALVGATLPDGSKHD